MDRWMEGQGRTKLSFNTHFKTVSTLLHNSLFIGKLELSWIQEFPVRISYAGLIRTVSLCL